MTTQILANACKCLSALARVFPVQTATKVHFMVKKFYFADIVRLESDEGKMDGTLAILQSLLYLAQLVCLHIYIC